MGKLKINMVNKDEWNIEIIASGLFYIYVKQFLNFSGKFFSLICSLGEQGIVLLANLIGNTVIIERINVKGGSGYM
ncbi:MAG: hypothetical protein NC827_04120 [Candidatus Omnitrophica bacterium]|nr:hypothetical protein [Candidatus Omnitrophota bacterium]MCM8802478.1 hypothetical protein [Candidatus Omnitrophota bacterium]